MRILPFCLIVIGLAASTSHAVTIAVDNQDFLYRMATEQRRDACIGLFMKYFNHPDVTLSNFKKERLADAFCSNFNIYNNFISNNSGALPRRSEGGEPLMLLLRDANHHDIKGTIVALHKALFFEEHSRRTLKRHEINSSPRPQTLSPETRNLIAIDIDKWIAEREKDSQGQLLQWLDEALRHPGVNNALVAIAHYDRAHYLEEGHLEVAEFLDSFTPVYFGLYKESCEHDLTPANP